MDIWVKIVQAEGKANTKVGICLKYARTSNNVRVAHLLVIIGEKVYFLNIYIYM